MLEGPAALSIALFLHCSASLGSLWALDLGGTHPSRSVPPCAASCRQGPEELCRQHPFANCSSTSKMQVFGDFPGVSCEMVPGGQAGGAHSLQGWPSPALTCEVLPPGTLGHRGGGNARAGCHKPLPCWRAIRAYAHQTALPPESRKSKPLVFWLPKGSIPTTAVQGTQGLGASLHFPAALRSQEDLIFLPSITKGVSKPEGALGFHGCSLN